MDCNHGHQANRRHWIAWRDAGLLVNEATGTLGITWSSAHFIHWPGGALLNLQYNATLHYLDPVLPGRKIRGWTQSFLEAIAALPTAINRCPMVYTRYSIISLGFDIVIWSFTGGFNKNEHAVVCHQNMACISPNSRIKQSPSTGFICPHVGSTWVPFTPSIIVVWVHHQLYPISRRPQKINCNKSPPDSANITHKPPLPWRRLVVMNISTEIDLLHWP